MVNERWIQNCSVKKAFIKISQNSQENTCAKVSFSVKCRLQPATLLKRKPQQKCFRINFANFSRTFFLRNTSGGCFCNLQWSRCALMNALLNISVLRKIISQPVTRFWKFFRNVVTQKELLLYKSTEGSLNSRNVVIIVLL